MVIRTLTRAALAVSFLSVSTSAFAWGKEGHSIIGSIADANLNSTAKLQVEALLAADNDFNGDRPGKKNLESIASWADEIRSTGYGKSKASWHYRNNPACHLDQLGPCQGGNCIDVKLAQQIAVLADKRVDMQSRAIALKWVVHLIGDIHQPLHAGEHDDKGGNDIQVAIEGVKTKGRRSLHSAWDTDLVRLLVSKELIAASVPPNYSAGTPAKWMSESARLSAEVAYSFHGFSCRAPSTNEIVVLSRSYQEEATKVIRSQLVSAGMRLAQVVNDSLK